MFRQKIDEATNCSCRLLLDQPNQYGIFKTKPSNTKVIKEPKQKYSLKSQVGSSTKQQGKIPSGQKTSLKVVKLTEDQKQWQNKNYNSNKQKLQKNVICSPENSQIRKVNEPIVQGNNFISEVRSFTKVQNSVQTAQNNKLKVQKKCDSQRPQHPQRQYSKSYMVNNFGHQSSSSSHIQQINKKQDLPRKTLNFQDYYKYVSNPYAASERNKENVLNAEAQTSRYKIDLKMKKQYRRSKNESVLFQDFNNNNVQTNIFHESLQKDDDKKQNVKGTFNGSLTTKTSVHSQNGSIKESTNQISLMNSKLISINENPSLQFKKMLINDQSEIDFMQQNHSEIFFQKNPRAMASQRRRNTSFVRSIIHNQSEYADNGNSLQQKLLMREAISYIERPQALIQNEKLQVEQKGRFPCQQKRIKDVKKELVKLSPVVNRKILIEKMNSFTDIINDTSECESVLGEGEMSGFSNEESVVIMRYKDLVEEVHGLSEFNNDVLMKQENLQLPSQLVQKEKTQNQYFSEPSNILTTIKPSVKSVTSLVQDSTITCDQNMKKTLKYITHPNSQYFTHQFSLLQQ